MLVIAYAVRGAKSAPVIRVPNPGGGSAGMLLNNVPAGTPAYTQTYSLCSSTGAPVTGVRVEPVKATGPVTVAWGVHHGQFNGVDSGYGPLCKMPGFIHRAVTEKCSEPF